MKVAITKPQSETKEETTEKQKSSESKPKQKPSVSSLSLPTEKSKPTKDISDMIICIYGEKKIGKTSLASCFPRALFMMCEPGGKGLEIAKVEPKDWKEFKAYIKLICENEHGFDTIPIDTVDIAYEMCLKYVCEREGIENPGELAYGAGWSLVKREFTGEINKLIRTGYGVIFLSHATEKDYMERTGGQYTKIVPTMPSQAKSFVSGLADLIIYYGYYGDDRLMTIRGSDSVESGHRMKYQFLVKDNPSKRVHSIPCGDSEDEAYINLLKAFKNEQLNDGRPDNEDEAALTEKLVPMNKKKSKEK